MTVVYFICAVILLAAGHICKAHRWRLFTGVYESVPVRQLTNALSAGYLLDFYLPLHLGDLVRCLIAGRGMVNGYGYALATVIVDRVLDVLSVAAVFLVMGAVTGTASIISAMADYALAAAVLLVLCAVALVFNQFFKKAALSVSSVFNDRIKFRLLFFLWSLISSFKDVFRKVSKPRLLGHTALMWAAYLASYGFIAAALSGVGNEMGFADVFLLMFRLDSLHLSTFGVTSSVFYAGAEMMFSVYILAPLPLLLLGAALFTRKSGNKAESPAKLLPQLKPAEQLHFLSSYFLGDERKALREYITMNSDVGILRDYSSGSDATTMLCVSGDETVFRKYAFGTAVTKLREQADWIKAHNETLELPEIVRTKQGEDSYCYDMRYDAEAVDFFQYIYSHPIEKSWAVLNRILTDLGCDLYAKEGEYASREDIDRYIDEKVTKNLRAIRQSRALGGLTEPDYIVINGVRRRNLPLLIKMLSAEHLREVFKTDRTSDIHGDLTLQNIICYTGGNAPCPYYLIDPNPADTYGTPNMDYAKVLQSLHGKYEFLEQSRQVSATKDSIDFFLPESSQYNRMYQEFCMWMDQCLTPEDIRSTYYHEVIHWLRLMPYRLRRDETTAARYYAALVLVMNAVWDRYEGN